MDEKLISICIPTYNRAAQIEKCVNKCLEMKEDSYEVVVLDNGSEDDTFVRLSHIQDERFKYVRTSTNLGFSSIGYVLKEGRGKYCLFLSDKDQLIINDYIELADLINNNPCVSIFHWEYVDLGGKVLRSVKEEYRTLLNQDTFEIELFSKYHFSYSAGFMFRKEDIEKVWDNIDKKSLLWKLYPQVLIAMQLGQCGDCLYIDEIKTVYRNEKRQLHYKQSSVTGMPYWHPDSRLEQNKEWLKVIFNMNMNNDIMVRLAHTICVNAIKQYGDYYQMICDERLFEDAFYAPYKTLLKKDMEKNLEEWEKEINKIEAVLLKELREYSKGKVSVNDSIELEYRNRRTEMKKQTLNIIRQKNY